MATSVQHTLECLTIILEDQQAFEQVVDRVFTDLDTNHNETLDTAEFSGYISRCCSAFGIRELPGEDQIKHVFRHLDLDNDSKVTKEELSVFLRHLFREQLKHCAETLRLKTHRSAKTQGHDQPNH